MRTNKNLLQKTIKKVCEPILLLKESMILFKGSKIQFYKIKLLKLVYTYIIIIF